MAEKSAFFNYVEGAENAEYGAEMFAEYFASLVGNGVFNGGDNLLVYCGGGDRVARVKPGKAWINGYYYRLEEDEAELTLDEADATNDRTDRVVLRLDTDVDVRSVALKVLKGVPAAAPAAPDIVRAGTIYDLSLATVTVTHNSATLAAAAVTDTRLINEVCGLVNSLITVDTTSMQAIFDALIDQCGDDWTAYMATTSGAWAAYMATTSGAWDAWFNQQQAGSPLLKSGGTMTGGLTAGGVQELTTAQVRNIVISTDTPTTGVANGDVWLKYS